LLLAVCLCGEKGTNVDFGSDIDLVMSSLIHCPVDNLTIRQIGWFARDVGVFYANRRKDRCHFALDLEVLSVAGESGEGKPVYAVGDGRVVLASYNW